MGLLELAKKNLDGYISVIDTINFIAKTQNTPIKHVALFLLSQRFESDIATYDVDQYYIVQSNDDYDWGVFNETNNILREIAEISDPLNLFFEITKESNIVNYNKISSFYWKRSDLYDYKLIKNLKIDWFFRLKDIQEFVLYGSDSIEEYNQLELFSNDAVKNLLKSCVPNYLNNSAYKHNLIDDFVFSILDFFDCDFDKGFQIEKEELQVFLFENNIVINDFNNHLFIKKGNIETFGNPPNYHEYYLSEENYINLALSDNWKDLSIINTNNYIDNQEHVLNELPKQIQILAKNSFFTVFDAACLISLDEPDIRHDINYNDDFRYGEHKQAVKLIENGIKAKKLYLDNDGAIPREPLQKFLLENNFFIVGFNDNQSTQEPIGCGHPTIQQTKLNIENLNAEITRLRELVAEKDEKIEKFKQSEKAKDYLNQLQNLRKESDKDSKINEQQEKIDQLSKVNEQFSNEIFSLKQRISAITSLNSNSLMTIQDQTKNFNCEDHIELSPEQEVPNSRQRNNVLNIIKVLVNMAGLPSEPYTAFNMMEAHAISKDMDLPSKDTTVKWTHKSS